jgi:hypothetical protein
LNRIKFFICALLFTAVTLNVYSQRFRNGTNELGFILGASNYFGDIAPEIKLKESHPAFGVFYKYHHSSFFSSRYQFIFAKISGDDRNFRGNAYRNIRFESNIFEFGYSTEFNFRPFGSGGRAYQEEQSTTYVFAGANLFLFEPITRLSSGDKVELRDIGTEGQVINNKRKYSLIQPALSFGLGYKFNIKRKTVIGIELGFRKTFTDYLDDTKGTYADYDALVNNQGLGAGEFGHPQTLNENPPIQAGTMRGDPNLKDWYFIAGITLSFRNIIRDPCP